MPYIQKVQKVLVENHGYEVFQVAAELSVVILSFGVAVISLHILFW